MSVVIRLAKTGKRGTRRYRVVALEKSAKRDSSPIELLGFYSKDGQMLKRDRIAFWQNNGAKLTPAVTRLLSN